MPVEIALKEQFKRWPAPDYRYLDGVWIKAIRKKALLSAHHSGTRVSVMDSPDFTFPISLHTPRVGSNLN